MKESSEQNIVNIRMLPSSIAMIMALILPWSDVLAFGPDWDEIGDAGSTPATAQRLFGAGTIASLSGRLGLAAILGEDEDQQDMYLVRLTQPTVITFSASTDPALGGFADFDTRLWLFDAGGFGLLANDDAERRVSQSTLLDASTDGTQVIITEPGLYFVAVTGDGSEPLASEDDALFSLDSPTEISGPDGPGGKSSIDHWTSGDQGEYVITFTGVGFITPGDLNGDGVVNVDDLLAMINAWGPCTDCDVAPCIVDLDGDCVVNVDDLLTVINNWT